jgi:hypothetical protein
MINTYLCHKFILIKEKNTILNKILKGKFMNLKNCLNMELYMTHQLKIYQDIKKLFSLKRNFYLKNSNISMFLRFYLKLKKILQIATKVKNLHFIKIYKLNN